MTDATADLRTVSWGDPGAPNTALLVHGLTGRTDTFHALADELLSAGLTGWRLLAADLRAATIYTKICHVASPQWSFRDKHQI